MIQEHNTIHIYDAPVPTPKDNTHWNSLGFMLFGLLVAWCLWAYVFRGGKPNKK